jgi:hypothetical protein
VLCLFLDQNNDYRPEDSFPASYHNFQTIIARKGLRFEFVMKESPYISLPRGVRGKKMSRVIVTKYGSRQVFYVIDPHLG